MKYLTRKEGILPDYIKVRELIQSIPEKRFRIGGMYGYLIAGRASEIVTKACPSDEGTTPYGPQGRDYSIMNYQDKEGKRHEALVLHVKTSKRDGLPRDVGIPLDSQIEPFAKKIHEYFQSFGPNDPVFYYTRQDLYNGSKEIFDGYIYPIEPYTIRKIDQPKFREIKNKVPEELRSLIKPPESIVYERKIPRHYRRLALHGAMRHYRTMELAQRFGLIKEERDIYTGHTTSGSDDRYSHLNWRIYFLKLLTPYL